MMRGEDHGLLILLSAVHACLTSYGAVADYNETIGGGWNRKPDRVVEFDLRMPPEYKVQISVAMSRETRMNIEATRAAILGYAPNKQAIDEMQAKVNEYERGDVIKGLRDASAVDRREIDGVRRELREMAQRLMKATEDKLASDARAAQAEAQLAALREHLHVTPLPPSSGDDTVDRFAVLEPY